MSVAPVVAGSGPKPDGERRFLIHGIALEVVITRSGLDKLSVYAGLEVPELWLWDGERFSLHALQGGAYVTTACSHFLPDLDFELLGRYVQERDQSAAVRAFVDELRRRMRTP
jgi:hypothetical protein